MLVGNDGEFQLSASRVPPNEITPHTLNAQLMFTVTERPGPAKADNRINPSH